MKSCFPGLLNKVNNTSLMKHPRLTQPAHIISRNFNGKFMKAIVFHSS